KIVLRNNIAEEVLNIIRDRWLSLKSRQGLSSFSVSTTSPGQPEPNPSDQAQVSSSRSLTGPLAKGQMMRDHSGEKPMFLSKKGLSRDIKGSELEDKILEDERKNGTHDSVEADKKIKNVVDNKELAHMSLS